MILLEVRRVELKNIILKKRKEKNMTQEQLAEKLDVARQTVSKWETGEAIPDVNSLKKLANLLGFSIDAVLGIEVEDDNDDKMEWLIIGGFVIGNSLGIIFDNLMLGYVFAMVGFGLSLIFKVFKK